MRTKEEARQFIEYVLMTMPSYDICERFISNAEDGVEFREMSMSIKSMEKISGKPIDSLCRKIKECEVFEFEKHFVTMIRFGLHVYKFQVFYE